MGAPFTSAICRPVSIGDAGSGAAPSSAPNITAAVKTRVIACISCSRARPSFAEPTRLRTKASLSNNGVPYGKAHALSRRSVALVDYAMDARGDRRTLRHPPLELEQG